jgi:predicted nucleic acid-binding protein
MKRYLLDTSALLSLRDDEPGAEQVALILRQAMQAKAVCYACFISGMEILYRVWKGKGEAAGRLAYQQCLALPLEWVHETQELLEKAAELKACHRVSLADAWIAAAAFLQTAVLVHKDPEFEVLKDLPQQVLPYN